MWWVKDWEGSSTGGVKCILYTHFRCVSICVEWIFYWCYCKAAILYVYVYYRSDHKSYPLNVPLSISCPGVCGVASCVRTGGQIEDDSCCDKTAYDWVYHDPLKPACASAPRDVPCNPGTTLVPTITPTTTTSCPASQLCELLHHP